MLYAPIDTLTTGEESIDVPWIGERLRPDMLPVPRDEGPFVSGLGASNPKGHAACILVLAEALGEVRPELAGDVVVAFGAGGMPTNAVDAAGLPAAGQHRPGRRLLVPAGARLVHRPRGDREAGRLRGARGGRAGLVRGRPSPASTPTSAAGTGCPTATRSSRPPRSSPGSSAGSADYPVRHRTATAAPQGVIGSIAGGWERMLAVTPALCRLRLDIRIAPGTTPLQVKRELARLRRRRWAATWTSISASRWCSPCRRRTRRRTRRSCAGPSAAWERTTGRPHDAGARTTAARPTRTSCAPGASRPRGSGCRR